MSRRTSIPVSRVALTRLLRGTLVLSLLLLAACRGPHPVAVQVDEIAAHGTATFQAPREQVFRACVEALVASGYTIAREDPAQGVIVTERLQARSAPVTRDGDLFVRRYELTVRPTAAATATGVAGVSGVAADVVARPLLAQSHHTVTGPTTPRERGPETVWTLEEERAEWRRLFSAVRHHLAAAAAPGAALTASRPDAAAGDP